ncbi:hypothetical protein FHR99_001550 [Litorivivens lipolytica]|uniref:Spore protein YkvP/CgeB glycosyl transferase-like domain-containing protein n=1 Tax=Litorivivens lipolytica TaxID=1524264 RepID=A0A7W4Z5B3_9GAMM|nr:glycosyltransferase [Litorivivens lipolytica]MBB3047314.1 hypothetical protein [Litorivivens lipolytica]
MSEPRILLLGQQDRDIDFSWLYSYVQRQPGATVASLNKKEIKALPRTLRRLKPRQYDRIILDLPFAKVHRFAKQLQTLPGLIIFEEDACQNFLEQSRWKGAFADYYRQLPHAQIILSGYATGQRFRQLGIENEVIPKGFDASTLQNHNTARDIEIGFIGRVQSAVYSQRRELLEAVDQALGVHLLRTESREDYRDTLNRIRIFLSADVGIGEYMAKNFEAMACGCAVVAARQGSGEEEALGLVDMQNIVLYDSADEAIQKIRELQTKPELLSMIAENGEAHARASFSHQHIADRLMELARKPMTMEPARAPSWWEKLTGF